MNQKTSINDQIGREEEEIEKPQALQRGTNKREKFEPLTKITKIWWNAAYVWNGKLKYLNANALYTTSHALLFAAGKLQIWGTPFSGLRSCCGTRVFRTWTTIRDLAVSAWGAHSVALKKICINLSARRGQFDNRGITIEGTFFLYLSSVVHETQKGRRTAPSQTLSPGLTGYARPRSNPGQAAAAIHPATGTVSTCSLLNLKQKPMVRRKCIRTPRHPLTATQSMNCFLRWERIPFFFLAALCFFIRSPRIVTSPATPRSPDQTKLVLLRVFGLF